MRSPDKIINIPINCFKVSFSPNIKYARIQVPTDSPNMDMETVEALTHFKSQLKIT